MKTPIAPVAFALVLALLQTPSLRADPAVDIVVHADRPATGLRPIWNYFGYDESLTTITPEGRHLLAELNKLSDTEPIRIRVHHLHTSGDGTLALKWSSTNVYTEDDAGNPVYDWTKIDEIFDELTRPGIEPFVQAGFMPQALSAAPEPYTPTLVKRGLPPGNILDGGAYHPPKDYAKYQAFIEAWVRHCVERYGRDAVASWLWELWNEPESPYFKGTVEEYCRLYDHFAAAVKTVVPEARVGGPHVTDPGWKRGDVFMEKFLEHCRSGRNAATGGVGAPLDFVAYHAKGTTRLDEHKRVEMNLRNQLQTIDTYSRIIARFPEFAGLPVYLGESDPEGCAGCPSTLDPQRDYRRTSQFASYTAASFMRKQDLAASHGGNLQGAVSWAFTFHDQPWFNGLRALTTNEVALPVFNAFKLFARLGPMRVESTSSGMLPTEAIIANSVRGDPDIGVVATRTDTGALRILLWNYHDVAEGFEQPTAVTLRVNGLSANHDLPAATITRVDEHNANAFTRWRNLGEPQDITPEQVAMLHDSASLKPEPLSPVSSLPRQSSAGATAGHLSPVSADFRLELLRQSVALIDIPVH
jgi:xylan 1,4-beta-xylosidase